MQYIFSNQYTQVFEFTDELLYGQKVTQGQFY